MDVLNMLRSTVSSTVSQISGALPGNPVTREFEVISHIASAGPGKDLVLNAFSDIIVIE
jgi:SCY1-like protein 2